MRRVAHRTTRSPPSTRQASRSRISRSRSPRSSARPSWASPHLSSSPRAAILVEGTSDLVAIETLAERRDVDTDAAGIALVPIGGAQAIGRYLDLFVPQGLKLAGLCDAAEEGEFMRALERAGLGSNLTRKAMEDLGFYVCVEDLEDELIRALGADTV